MSGIHLTDYHESVKAWFENNFEWLNLVSYYPEIKTPVPCPALFFSVEGWEPSERQPGNGQFNTTLHVEALLVVGVDDPVNQITARNAAMAVSSKIQGCNLGVKALPAVCIGVQPDALKPELDEYVVWSVNFVQTVNIGVELTQEEFRAGLRLAVNPVDENDDTEYQDLSEFCEKLN